MIHTSLEVAYIALLLLLCSGFALYETGYGVCETVVESFCKRLMTFAVSLTSFGISAVLFNPQFLANVPTIVMLLALLAVFTHIVTAMTKSFAYASVIAIAVGAVIFPLMLRVVSYDSAIATYGYYDAAGSGIVHFAGAVVAFLMSAYMSKIHDWSSLSIKRPAIASLGFLCIWAAWGLFVIILSAPIIGSDPTAWIRGIVVSSTSAAWGATASVLFSYIVLGKARVRSCTIGGLAGLVVVSADPFSINLFQAVAYGVVAGILAVSVSQLMKRFELKDPCNVVAIHGPAGALGVLLVSISNTSVSFTSQLHGLAVLCILSVIAAVFLCELGASMQNYICNRSLNLQR